MSMIAYELENQDGINYYASGIDDLKMDRLIDQDWEDLNEVSLSLTKLIKGDGYLTSFSVVDRIWTTEEYSLWINWWCSLGFRCSFEQAGGCEREVQKGKTYWTLWYMYRALLESP